MVTLKSVFLSHSLFMTFYGDSESFSLMLQSIHSFPIPIDFSFRIGNHSYEIYKLFACMLSPAVLHALQSDATIEEYQINFDGDKSIFTKILNIFTGSPFEITEDNSYDVYKIATQLQNEGLLRLSMNSMVNNLTITNIFKKISFALKYNILLTPFIEYIAINFQQLSSDETFFNLPIEIIVDILKNDKLLIPDYPWLVKWIENTIEQRGDKYLVLIESIKFSNLEISDIYKILEMVKSANMTSEICFKLKSFFIDILRTMTFTVEYKNQDDSLHGIIDHLTAKYGNVVDKGLVNVIAPVNGLMACDLLNYSPPIGINSHWKNENRQDQNWIIFDFLTYTIQLTAYTIRGCFCQDYNCRPKSWIIWGSNDKNDWTNLSEVKDCTSIDRPYGMMTFKIEKNTQSFRFIKYTQLENNAKKYHNVVHLSAFEFFGTLSSTRFIKNNL